MADAVEERMKLIPLLDFSCGTRHSLTERGVLVAFAMYSQHACCHLGASLAAD
jgi:hypothetical protein